MSQPLLEVKDLSIKYRTPDGDIAAVSDASFSFGRGEYFGLVGESGCGKSTIAKAIVGGLDDNGVVDSGQILYDGREIQDLSERELNDTVRWKEISLIPQSSMNSLDPLQRISDKAIELAKFHTEMSKGEAVEKLRDLFRIVGIDTDRIHDYPHQFSGGMQQRGIIALALLLDPDLIIADEPTTALDVIMQDQVFRYLDEIKENNVSMMMITHDISLVFEACDKMAIMHAGQIAETGTVKELYKNPHHPYSILLQNAFPDIRDPNRDLQIIEGYPPQVKGEVTACTFADRCPWAEPECTDGVPQLEPAEAGGSAHEVACFRQAAVQEEVKNQPDARRSKSDGATQLDASNKATGGNND